MLRALMGIMIRLGWEIWKRSDKKERNIFFSLEPVGELDFEGAKPLNQERIHVKMLKCLKCRQEFYDRVHKLKFMAHHLNIIRRWPGSSRRWDAGVRYSIMTRWWLGRFKNHGLDGIILSLSGLRKSRRLLLPLLRVIALFWQTQLD